MIDLISTGSPAREPAGPAWEPGSDPKHPAWEPVPTGLGAGLAPEAPGTGSGSTGQGAGLVPEVPGTGAGWTGQQAGQAVFHDSLPLFFSFLCKIFSQPTIANHLYLRNYESTT